LHSNDDHKYALVYPSLKVVDEPLSCITNPEQDPSSESYDVHDQSCKPHVTKADIFPPVPNPISSKILDRYRPLKLLPLSFMTFLQSIISTSLCLMENLTTSQLKKHLQDFEHFIDLFEVEHDDVCMRAFSQSLQGDAKEWFRNLQPESISSWEELKDVFLKFWGERKSWDQHLAEFHAMKRQRDETISMFNKIFSSFYYNMPKEVQPLKLFPGCVMQQPFIQSYLFFSWRGGYVTLQ
jgi:hypothetical protein